MDNIRIALIGPNTIDQTPTFIMQHKNSLKGNLTYYFNGVLPEENTIEGLLLNRSKKLIYSLKYILNISHLSIKEQALVSSFKKNKIQVVVTEYGTTAVAVLNVCKYLKIPLIPIFHGYDASIRTLLEEKKNLYQELFTYAIQIVCVSTTIKSKLISLGCNPLKITVTPCAPEDTFYNITPSFQKPIFVGIGRFVDKKAPYYTILAFQKVLSEFPNARLIIAGDGPLYPTCKNIVKHLKLDTNIELLGTVTPDKIMNLFSKSLAFVQHSIIAENGDSEGSPVAILEASLSGLPIISTYHSGIPDIVDDNKTGFLVREHDVNDMASKMKILLNDFQLAKKMGMHGKRFVKANYSKKMHTDILNNLIEKSIA